MDFLKKAAHDLSESQHNNQQGGQNQQQNLNQDPNLNQNQGQPAQNNGAPQQQDDYVDKAFAFGAKKFGLNLSREQEEKITDGGRSAYVKYSGKQVDPKYSN